MKDKDYEDGHKYGVSFAEQDFPRWRDKEEIRPFSWPRVASDVREFVEDCVPMMSITFLKGEAQEAREKGINPDYLPIPKAFMQGLKDGYRARLTELLNEFVR
jgi:hypothetical protein